MGPSRDDAYPVQMLSYDPPFDVGLTPAIPQHSTYDAVMALSKRQLDRIKAVFILTKLISYPDAHQEFLVAFVAPWYYPFRESLLVY